MIVSIMQPAYLPWLGYFDRVQRSDLHIVLDTVQLEHQTKTAFTNRNRVRTAIGWTWLTVPVQTAGQQHTPIHDIAIASSPAWARKHATTLRQSYGRAPHWHRLVPLFDDLYGREWTRLFDLLTTSTSALCALLGVQTPMVSASSLGVTGTKADLVLALCRAVGATTYLSGPFGRDYLDEAAFADAGMTLAYHDYVHPAYTQGTAPFVPYLSVVDLMAHHGPDSLSILTGHAGAADA
jgi:hypothetical protein